MSTKNKFPLFAEREGMTLKKICAFWKAAVKGGEGIEIKYNLDTDDEIIALHDAAALYVRDWDEHPDDHAEIINLYEEQLRYARSHIKDINSGKTELPPCLLLLNIWFLERIGHLKTDNFNGVLFFWEL
ncbi:MAG: hypothetical protein ACLQQ4_06515 [Bacteroidia bacterium]